MAFKDGVATGTVSGYTLTGYGLVTSVAVTPVDPVYNGSSLTGHLTFLLDSMTTANSDVDLAVSVSSDFSSTVYTTTMTNIVDGPYTVQATGLTANAKYYWRVRARETGTTTWGPWSLYGDGVPNPAGIPVTLSAPLSSGFSSGYPPSNAIDANVGTFWHSTGAAMPQWLSFSMASSTLTAVRIRDRGFSTSRYMSALQIQGSNDGSAWTTIQTFTGLTAGDWAGNVHTFALPVSGPWTFLRVYCTASSGDNNIALSEVEAFVDAPTGVPGVPYVFTYAPGGSEAHAAIHLNMGCENFTSPVAAEGINLNMGFLDTQVRDSEEYVHLNMGFHVTLNRDGHEYIHIGDISTNAPVPHLWFLWKPYGFTGNEVWAFGQGFGNPQEQYSGLMKIDPGPDYATADIIAGVNEWYQEIAGPNAYLPSRVIRPGSDTVAPVVDPETSIIRFVIPGGIAPVADPYTHKMYVQHVGGIGNKVNWLHYPTIPMPQANVKRGVNVASRMRLSATHPGGGIEQLYFFTQVPAYVITAGRAERPAALTAGARAVGELGTWSTEDALADALAVDLGATYRWLPDESKLVAHPELGTGVVLWNPSVGSTASAWKLRPDTSPYIDPAYSIPSRLGDQAVPAMVFPGDAFAELNATINTGPTFTFALVAVVHPAPGGRGTVLSTFQPTPTPGDNDWELFYESDQMKLAIGGLFTRRQRSSTSGRPVILIGAVSGRATRLLVVDEKPTTHTSIRTTMAATGNKAYLARSWRVDIEDADLANMDVLEVAWWNTGLSMAQMWAAATKLDGIYGVTR